MLESRGVWRRNVDEEMIRIKDCLTAFPMIAFDTEFPGFIYWTSRYASEDERYKGMKINVEGTKLIQFGFTLFNDRGEIGGTWEVNFSNFGDPSDTRNANSMDFLARNGMDLKKIRAEGIDMFQYGFFPKFFDMLSYQDNIQWVTFQGNYDLAYVISILNKGLRFPKMLPETPDDFVDAVGRIFGVVYDLKVIASAYEWLGNHMGLEQLARKLRIQRVGQAHHAGSDSLLTAFVFIKINELCLDAKEARGYIYGMRRQVVPTRPTMISDAMMFHKSGLFSYASILCNGYANYDPRMFYNGLSFGSFGRVCNSMLQYTASHGSETNAPDRFVSG